MARVPFQRRQDPVGAALRGPQLEVKTRPIADLIPDPRNPRIHSKSQLRKIARSIKTFGFVFPIVTDASGRVIVGHGRLAAAKELGLEEVPTIALENLTDAQARALALADNQLATLAEWDEGLLREQVKLLLESGLNLSIEDLGFETAQIDLLVGEPATKAPGQDPADKIPAPKPRVVSTPGDLWELGRHRVLVGNALEPRAFDALMNGQKAHAVVSDLPYNLAAKDISGLGSVHHEDFAMAAGEMSEPEFTQFLTSVCTQYVRHTVDGSLHYLFMDWRHLWELLSVGRKTYTELKALCAWVKANGGMGSLYRSQHELVLVFKNGRKPHRNNIELGKHGRYRTNVWTLPGMNSFGRATDDGVSLADHATIKPTQLIVDIILDCTRRGDLVLDATLGSGTTVIAAERTGRACYGIEIEPRFVDLTVRRWQKFTGGEARHAASGRTFDAIAAKLARKGVRHV